MNILDFDNTIYEGDTSFDMLKYSLRKHPLITLLSVFRALPFLINYRFFGGEFECAKERLFSYLFKIKDLDDYINEFVVVHMKNIKPWYKKRNKENDIIISASYELWIKPFCKKIGIKNVIATKTNEKGKLDGKNCKGYEKVNRLYKEYPDTTINEAYGDSITDVPMLSIAKYPYVVVKDKLIPYTKGYKFDD